MGPGNSGAGNLGSRQQNKFKFLKSKKITSTPPTPTPIENLASITKQSPLEKKTTKILLNLGFSGIFLGAPPPEPLLTG